MSRETIKAYLNYAIILGLMIFFRYLPPPEGLNSVSMEVIGIFLGTLYGWITVSMGWPSIVGLVAFGLSNYTSMSGALSYGFGGEIIVMVLALLLFAAFVQQADITDFILDFLMRRKSCQGRPYVLLGYFFLAGYIASLLSYCTAVFIIFIGFFKAMMQKSGMQPYSRAVPCLMIGMILAILYPELALPFKSTSIYCIGTFEAMSGMKVSIPDYILFMMPMTLAAVGLHLLSCKYIFRIDVSCLANYTYDSSKKYELSKRQKYSLIGGTLALLALLVPGIIPEGCSIKPFIDELGGSGLTLLVICALMMVRVDDKPLMDLKEVAAFFPWQIFFCMAFLFPVAAAISSDAVGLKHVLASSGQELLQGLPVALTVIMFVLLPAFLTNFMNNAIIGIIGLSILGTIQAGLSANILILFCLISYAAQIGFFFPSANPMTTIAFAQKDILTFNQMVRFGLGTWVIQCLFLAGAGMLWGSIVF